MPNSEIAVRGQKTAYYQTGLRLSSLMANFKIKFGPRLERSWYELFKIMNCNGVKNPHKEVILGPSLVSPKL